MDEIKFDKSFRDRTYKFSLSCIHFITELNFDRKFSPIINQFIRSSTSIGANVIEAKSSSSKREFINYFQIALKSANETKYWLCLIRDGLKIDNDNLKNILQEADELSKILAQSVLTMKENMKLVSSK